MRMFRNVGLMIVISAFAVGIAMPVQGADESNVIAKVGSIVVTKEDVQREIERRLPLQVSFHGEMKAEKIEKIRAEAKEALITRAYKVQYALDNEISVNAKAVDDAWSSALAKNPKLAAVPAVQAENFKRELYLDLLAKQTENVVVNSKVAVTDEEVRKYYDANKSQFLRAKLFKASQVFVKVDPAASAEEKAARRQKAEKILERAKAGEDFYNLAYYESDDRSRYVGGSLGSFHSGQVVPEFDTILQKMKPGDVAGPIQTLNGYHVVKLDDVQPEKQMSLEESAVNLKARLSEEKRKKLYSEWLEALHRKYPLQSP